jgi:hypothetical protein
MLSDRAQRAGRWHFAEGSRVAGKSARPVIELAQETTTGQRSAPRRLRL